ncbi:MAG: LysR family transcriptional regulator [Proteobacteria bacterium]|nr:LysR family transcriptional regulator [Pseudomonadota bacterium]MBU1582895.1 LysR family transcriptional regulator [Pseudomonadota bacterium]MBU2451996.1 LysR family transcriptional regulator [Pseudomonadota bacterium]MBU2630617.1 LysR family transcriptional regulator [Pseudomonadota bacterium]
MEIYQLKSFIAVSETGNLTRAARKINISQSALSSQIKALEQELRVTLFTRLARGMHLTQNGAQLLEQADKIVQAAEKMKQTALGLQHEISGELNIGINTDPQFLEISDITRRISKSMPGIKLCFIESQTFETLKMMQDKQIDVGFHYGSLENNAVYSKTLSGVTICVVIPIEMAKKNETASIEKLVTLPWVWTRHGCPFHAAFEKHLDNQNLVLNPVTDAVEENIVRELVKSGRGAALMRKDEAQELVRQGFAVIWQGFELPIPLGIACLEKRKSEKIISGFFQVITAKYDIF